MDPGAFDDELFQRGLELRRSVLGDAYVDRALGAADELDREFQHFVTASCWGATWGRSALELRDRSIVTLAILATLGRTAELELHLRGALRNGCSVNELRDTLFHVATYAGMPAGVEAFRAARRVLAAVEAEDRPEEDRDV